MPASDETLPDWIDIPPLPEPADETGIMLFVTLVIGGVLLGWLLYLFINNRHHHKQVHLHQIPTLATSGRQKLLILQRVLLTRMNVSDLNDVVFNESEQSNWEQFRERLKYYRFHSKAPTQDAIERLITEAHDWVDKA